VASALVLTGATVIDGTGAAARTGMTLVLRDGIIAALHADGTAPIPAGAEVRLKVAREGKLTELRIVSADRSDFLKKPHLH